MYELFCWAAKIAPNLPRRLRQIIAVAVGTLAWGLARRRRQHVTANVAQVLGPRVRHSALGRVRIQRVVRRIFCHCILNYLDLLALPAVGRQDIVARLDVSGVENLKDALSWGRGVVLFSAHLGPFEYLPAWFSVQGYDLVVPVENLPDERLLRLTLDLRRRNAVEFVSLHGTKAVRMMFDALRRNQLVLITADRAIEGESVITDFFGAPARLPVGPVELSLRTGAPLVGAFGWRKPDGRMAAEFTPLTLALSDDQRGNKEALQTALTRQLERTISRHLDEWLVFESIWHEDQRAGRP